MEANTKVTMDNLIPPVEAIIITIMAIIEAEVVVAMAETITDPHELPKENLEDSLGTVYHNYTHTDIPPKVPEEIEKLEYVYQHFQDHRKGI